MWHSSPTPGPSHSRSSPGPMLSTSALDPLLSKPTRTPLFTRDMVADSSCSSATLRHSSPNQPPNSPTLFNDQSPCHSHCSTPSTDTQVMPPSGQLPRVPLLRAEVLSRDLDFAMARLACDIGRDSESFQLI